MSFHVCTAEDMHPYECDGRFKCRHCDRRVTSDHDPATCALCDPEYDFQPNPHRAEETTWYDFQPNPHRAEETT